MMFIHDEDNNGMRIDAVWVFISSDETGEGVIAGPLMGHGSMIPLIAADETRLESLRPVAAQFARMTKKTVKLIKLTTREEIEVIAP